MNSVAHIVLDVDREIVLLDDLLDQNICAVSLESIILPIKSAIMWISPTRTFACNFEEQKLQCIQCTVPAYFVNVHLKWYIINLEFQN